MALYRFQVIAAGDTLLPRDSIVNDLYYTRTLDSGDDVGLCTDLANLFGTMWYKPGQIRVNMYDVHPGQKSGPPRATAVRSAASPMSSSCPREVALCLSFWASNRPDPHRRGRIFLNMSCSAFGTPTMRPTTAQMTAVLNLGDGLAGIGGADVSWQVFSKTLGQSNDVTNTWVDDEWDTIRSRGLLKTLQTVRNV